MLRRPGAARQGPRHPRRRCEVRFLLLIAIAGKVHDVLFLCSGNSAHSVRAEGLLKSGHAGTPLASEFLGTALLLAVVIGSGVMGERLAAGNVAVALLANTLATVGGLYILVEVFGPLSGAHFNPAGSAVMAWRGKLGRGALVPYVVAQLFGAMLGACMAHAMFDLSILQLSTRSRTGTGQWIAEIVATAGLLLVILRAPAGRAAPMVASYIGAAYWFTASTSFANPAAVFGRMFSDTFAGTAPSSAPGFMLAELVGAATGLAIHNALEPRVHAGGHPNAIEASGESEGSMPTNSTRP